jgi:hypothetical protein
MTPTQAIEELPCGCAGKKCAERHTGTERCPNRAELMFTYNGNDIAMCEACLRQHASPVEETIQ